MSPLVSYPSDQKFQELLTSIALQKLGVDSARETASRVYKLSPPPQLKLSGIEAEEYLRTILSLTQ